MMSTFADLVRARVGVALIAAGVFAAVIALPVSGHAQETSPDSAAKKVKVSKLFKQEAPFDVTFTANFKMLRRDKAATAPWHAASLGYTDSAGKAVTIPVRARTRGIWRLAHCEFPPVRLNFAGKTSKGTLFDDLDEPKLVSYCKSGSRSEQYVLQELQLYRVYRLLTPYSHEVRLLRVSYVDSASRKTEMTRYAFMVEDPARMAERLRGRMFKDKGAGPDDLDPKLAAIAFLFEYMIGNTDFSFSTLHNGETMTTPGGTLAPIPYDFDFAGAIAPPEALPAPGLRIKSVRERLFRGYCAIKAEYPAAIALFQAKKPAIYALYADSVGMLLDRKGAEETLAYFDAFYKAVETPKAFEKNALADCSDRR